MTPFAPTIFPGGTHFKHGVLETLSIFWITFPPKFTYSFFQNRKTGWRKGGESFLHVFHRERGETLRLLTRLMAWRQGFQEIWSIQVSENNMKPRRDVPPFEEEMLWHVYKSGRGPDLEDPTRKNWSRLRTVNLPFTPPTFPTSDSTRSVGGLRNWGDELRNWFTKCTIFWLLALKSYQERFRNLEDNLEKGKQIYVDFDFC